MEEKYHQVVAAILQMAAIAEDAETFPWQVVEVIPKQLNSEYLVFIFLLDKSEKWLWARAGTGEPGRIMVVERAWRMEAGSRNEEAEAVMSGKPFLLDLDRRGADAKEGLYRRGQLFAERWSLSLPLFYNEQAIGVLAVYSRDPLFDSAWIPAWERIAEVVALRIGVGV